MINEKELKKFLKEAKTNTYASDGEEREVRLNDGSKKFVYQKGNFSYRDVYYGFNPFIGEEIVFYKGKPFWGMNYYGKIIIESVSAKAMYLFLKEALINIPADKPFRGPANFNKDDFKYINNINGNVEQFNGQEKIFYRKAVIYILDYFGGLIENNNKS